MRDCDEFSGDSGNDDLVGFTSGAQAICEGLENRIVEAAIESILEKGVVQ